MARTGSQGDGMGGVSQIAYGGIGRRCAAAALAASLLPAACADPSSAPPSASLGVTERGHAAESDARRPPPVDVAPLAAAHKANPGDAEAALAYARGLRATGAKREALA